ncbi:unnamed protein product [Parajaminaea phylloscopi]
MADCPVTLSVQMPLKEESSGSSDFPSPTAFFRTMSSTTPSTASSVTSPFAFDHRVCDFSASSPGRFVFSATGTPAYADSANPFFAEFEAGLIRQAKVIGLSSSSGPGAAALSTAAPTLKLDMAPSDDMSDWDATVRKRAFKRLSLGSSVASSAASATASESGEDVAELGWARFSAADHHHVSLSREGSSSGPVALDNPIDHSLSEAFSQQHLAGPCSFQDHYQPSPAATADDAARMIAPAPPAPFNLEDFISPDGGDDQQHAGLAVGHQLHHDSSNAWPGQGLGPSFASDGPADHPQGHSQSSAPGQHYPHLYHPQQLAPRRDLSESTSGTLFSGHSDASSSPMTPSSSSSSGVFEDASSHKSSPSLLAARGPAHGVAGRSMSFNGQASSPQHGFSNNALTVPGQQADAIHSPVPTHPSLLRLTAVKSETPARSHSTPNIHEGLSCNPAYITPASAAAATRSYTGHLESPVSGASASAYPASALFADGTRHGFPDSPASTVLSSPLQWSAALIADDGSGEETYRASSFAQGMPVTTLSSSLPTSRQALYRSHSHIPAPSPLPPASPSPHSAGGAGQPIRQMRSSLAAASAHASPYGTPSSATSAYHLHHGSPISGAVQHPLLSTSGHSLLDLQNPYSGVITKRSRGRRVPSTPEEMTNVGKSGKVYTCKVPGCGKLFKRSEHLKRHIRSIHTDEKPFLCQICQKRFSRHDNLNQHMRVHGPAAVAALSADGGSSMQSDSGDEDAPSPSPSSSSQSHLPMGTSFMETNGGTITNRRRHHAQALDNDIFDFENP